MGSSNALPKYANTQEPIVKRGQFQIETLLLENYLLKQEVQVIREEIQGARGSC